MRAEGVEPRHAGWLRWTAKLVHASGPGWTVNSEVAVGQRPNRKVCSDCRRDEGVTGTTQIVLRGCCLSFGVRTSREMEASFIDGIIFGRQMTTEAESNQRDLTWRGTQACLWDYVPYVHLDALKSMEKRYRCTGLIEVFCNGSLKDIFRSGPQCTQRLRASRPHRIPSAGPFLPALHVQGL